MKFLPAMVPIPERIHPGSSSIPGGAFQNRNYEKHLPGIGTIAGRNFISFPLAIWIKKSAKRRVYSVSQIFLLQLSAM